MSLLSLIKGKDGPSGFGYASTAEDVTAGLDLRGKHILITGVNSGLGLESARVLAMRGATIVGAARTEQKAREACRGFEDALVPLSCDLAEPESVRACVARAREIGITIDALICNAGIMALPKREVRHGHELQFLTNHIGHFILVMGLLDQLADQGRVVMLSSRAHHQAPEGGIQFDDLSFESGYSPWASYGQSKLANLLFARALSRRLAGTKKTSNAVHPGVIATNLTRHMSLGVRISVPIAAAIAMKSIPEGAATQCFVATHPSIEGVSGEYFADSNVARSSRYGRDEALGERLWDVTESIVADLGGPA